MIGFLLTGLSSDTQALVWKEVLSIVLEIEEPL